MRTPTLIGTIIFGLSILVIAIGALRLDFLVPTYTGGAKFELIFIWISGIVGGIGLGYGSRESYGYGENNTATIIGGLGFIGSIVIAVWMLVNGTPPLEGIVVGFVSAILAIIGLYMMVVSTQEKY
ncbi:MAG: hypothetical protein ACFFE4_23460 [Candidatus Thorarchaeota archaeon]